MRILKNLPNRLGMLRLAATKTLSNCQRIGDKVPIYTMSEQEIRDYFSPDSSQSTLKEQKLFHIFTQGIDYYYDEGYKDTIYQLIDEPFNEFCQDNHEWMTITDARAFIASIRKDYRDLDLGPEDMDQETKTRFKACQEYVSLYNNNQYQKRLSKKKVINK